MQYRRLGTTDIDVSAVIMGCWAIVGDSTWGPQDEHDAVGAINRAYELGITTYDTAEAYGDGRSEELLGRVLHDRRNNVVLASKVSPDNLAPRRLRRACENSLRRLRSDRIDIYQIHWPGRTIPPDDTLRAMEGLRDEGKIRAMGCSNFGPQDLAEALARARIESNQIAYNLLWRGVEYNLQPLCTENHVSLLAYCPLAQGLLTGKFASPDAVPEGRARTRHFGPRRARIRHGEGGAEELTFRTIQRIRELCRRLRLPMASVALAYLLTRPAVAGAVVGLRSAEQAETNASAAELQLTEDVVCELDDITDELKAHFGPALDLWQDEERTR